MPQIAAHLIIAEKLKRRLNNPAFIQQNLNSFNLGAVGPDLSLFLFDEVGSNEVLNQVISIYRTMNKVSGIAKEVRDQIGGPADDIDDWVTGGLSTSITNLMDRSYSAIETATKLTATHGGSVTLENPFEGLGLENIPNGPTITVQSSDISFLLRRFGHPYSEDTERIPFTSESYKTKKNCYEDWWWMDILHYRRTMKFADTLVQKAGNDDFLKAYSYGYWTHVAGDIVGHPYVNAIVGGPFRNHVIRHMVIENIIDTWVWNHYKSEDLINAAFQEKIEVGNRFQEISRLLISSMDDVYKNQNPSINTAKGVPSESDFQRAYDLYMLFLELSTDAKIEQPEIPPENPEAFFQELANSLGDTADDLSEQFNGNNEWWENLLAPFLAAAYALILLFKILTLPAAIITRLITLSSRWFLYIIEVSLHNYIMSARWQLALSGWGKPSRIDLDKAFAQMSVRVPPDRSGQQAFNYPMNQVPHDDFGFWLRDPRDFGVGIESDKYGNDYESCPYPAGAYPTEFIEGSGFFSPQESVLKDFSNAENFIATRKLETDTFRNAQFGNAVEFSEMLIKGDFEYGPYDLDGDKGYGFLGWNHDKEYSDGDSC